MQRFYVWQCMQGVCRVLVYAGCQCLQHVCRMLVYTVRRVFVYAVAYAGCIQGVSVYRVLVQVYGGVCRVLMSAACMQDGTVVYAGCLCMWQCMQGVYRVLVCAGCQCIVKCAGCQCMVVYAGCQYMQGVCRELPGCLEPHNSIHVKLLHKQTQSTIIVMTLLNIVLNSHQSNRLTVRLTRKYVQSRPWYETKRYILHFQNVYMAIFKNFLSFRFIPISIFRVHASIKTFEKDNQTNLTINIKL